MFGRMVRVADVELSLPSPSRVRLLNSQLWWLELSCRVGQAGGQLLV